MICGPVINVGDVVLYQDEWSKVAFVEIDHDLGQDDWLILRDGRECYSSWVDEHRTYDELYRPETEFDIESVIRFGEWWESRKEDVMENEIYTAIVGWRIGSHWIGRGLTKTEAEGEPSLVSFDYEMIYDREDSKGDVLGFYHTHPNFVADPSTTDYKTMGTWTTSFGRPMLCMIEGTDGLKAHWFIDDETDHETLWVRKIGKWFIGKLKY